MRSKYLHLSYLSCIGILIVLLISQYFYKPIEIPIKAAGLYIFVDPSNIIKKYQFVFDYDNHYVQYDNYQSIMEGKYTEIGENLYDLGNGYMAVILNKRLSIIRHDGDKFSLLIEYEKVSNTPFIYGGDLIH